MKEHQTTTALTEIELVRQALEGGKRKSLRKLLRGMHAAKVASVLEALDPAQRTVAWQQLDEAVEPAVLAHVSADLHGQFAPADEELPEARADTRKTELAQLRRAVHRGKLKRAGRMLQQIHPAKIAGLLESLPPAERFTAWEMVESEAAGEILVHLHEEVRTQLALAMEPEDLTEAARGLELDDLVDLLQDLPDATVLQLLQAMDRREREQLETMLNYPEDSAGGLMNTDHISVRADLAIASVLRYLRLLDDLADNTNIVMVVDRDDRYLGVLRVKHLLTSHPEQRVADVMDRDFPPIPADLPSREVARRFEELDWLSAPVVDADRRLLGRITVDDVVDVIREESERVLMHAAGLDEDDDMFAPVIVSTRRRALWLGINLLTAFLAAWVIGLFEGTLEKVVALAVLMPIVASMGGIAGTQTLTLVIRGMALGQLERGNALVLLRKEFGIGVLNGLLWALVVAALALLWFGSWEIGGIIAVAILLNLLCAAAAGVAIPLLLRRMKVDPALAGGVVLTTITDVVGFFAFLGLATLWLL